MIKSPIDGAELAFGQLTLWDTQDIVLQKDRIMQIMNRRYSFWMVNAICITQKKNYIIANSPEIATYLAKILVLAMVDNWLVSKRLYLRKEIIGKMIQK